MKTRHWLLLQGRTPRGLITSREDNKAATVEATFLLPLLNFIWLGLRLKDACREMTRNGKHSSCGRMVNRSWSHTEQRRHNILHPPWSCRRNQRGDWFNSGPFASADDCVLWFSWSLSEGLEDYLAEVCAEAVVRCTPKSVGRHCQHEWSKTSRAQTGMPVFAMLR